MRESTTSAAAAKPSTGRCYRCAVACARSPRHRRPKRWLGALARALRPGGRQRCRARRGRAVGGERAGRMRRVKPRVIRRNHRLEERLAAASDDGDLGPSNACSTPWGNRTTRLRNAPAARSRLAPMSPRATGPTAAADSPIDGHGTCQTHPDTTSAAERSPDQRPPREDPTASETRTVGFSQRARECYAHLQERRARKQGCLSDHFPLKKINFGIRSPFSAPPLLGR